MDLIQSRKPNLEEHVASLSEERRSSSREHCWFEAITQIDGIPRDTVTLSNVSAEGALMIVTLGTTVPDEFQLLGLNEDVVDCRRIWIKGQSVGIAFMSALELSETRDTLTSDIVEPARILDLK